MGTEPVHVRAFSHVAITVADIDRSLDFYRTVLGFRLLSDMRGGGVQRASLALGEVSLELFAGPADERSFVPVPTEFGRPQLALTVDDLEQAIAAVEAHGAERWGSRFDTPASSLIWIRDPDGTPIQLHQFADGSRHVVEMLSRR